MQKTRSLNLIVLMSLMLLVVRPGAAPGPSAAAGTPGAAPGAPVPLVVGGQVEERPATSGLDRELRALVPRGSGVVWAAWSVPVLEGDQRICCYGPSMKHRRGTPAQETCELERDKGFNIFTDDELPRPRFDYVHILARVGSSGVSRVRAFSEDCRLNPSGASFVLLTGVTSAQSLEWLEGLVGGKTGHAGDEPGDGAMTAIALHEDSRATRILESIATRHPSRETRGQALFWLGNTRGRAGYEVVRRVVLHDPDDEVRRKGIFALSQSPVPEAIETMIGLAHDDRDRDVRGEALFWLAQAAGRRASEDVHRALTDAIDNDPETEVRKKAVFALSQLPRDEGVPLLIKVARTHSNAEIRREAIFWLGQSGDPRALEFIEEILES